jgi:hypothetical protein
MVRAASKLSRGLHAGTLWRRVNLLKGSAVVDELNVIVFVEFSTAAIFA